MVVNKRVLYTGIPDGYPEEGKHMRVVESTIDLEAKLSEGEFILKTLEISLERYMGGRMRDPKIKSYAAPFDLNEPMLGDTMSVVVNSNNPDYKVGDLVHGRYGAGKFESYVRVTPEYAKAAYVVRNDAKESGLPIRHYIGALAIPGMTAYYGLHKIGKPKPGETLYVSAAGSSVGQLVGQFGKAAGCYVVGSAGSDEKVEYLKSIGFDAVFNYKKGDIEENLRKHCPNGIDVYFELVGGKTLDAVLAVANNFSRIIACGMLSQYKPNKPEPIHNSLNIIVKRIKCDGFIISDHMDFEETFMKEVTPMFVSGKVKYEESVVNGIERTPQAFIDVLRDNVFGKQIVHVADL